MSTPNMQAFFDRAHGDEVLQKKIAEIRLLPPAQAAVALAQLAATMGCPFSAEELSEAELENVAGGWMRWSHSDRLPEK